MWWRILSFLKKQHPSTIAHQIKSKSIITVDQNGQCVHLISKKLLGLGTGKLKLGNWDGPQIHQLIIGSTNSKASMIEFERFAWKPFVVITKNCP